MSTPIVLDNALIKGIFHDTAMTQVAISSAGAGAPSGAVTDANAPVVERMRPPQTQGSASTVPSLTHRRVVLTADSVGDGAAEADAIVAPASITVAGVPLPLSEHLTKEAVNIRAVMQHRHILDARKQQAVKEIADLRSKITTLEISVVKLDGAVEALDNTVRNLTTIQNSYASGASIEDTMMHLSRQADKALQST